MMQTKALPVMGDWSERAACRTKPTTWWYTNAPNDEDYDYTAAAVVCAGCPVKEECLEFALATPVSQDLGMWGGLRRAERLKIRQRRKQAAKELRQEQELTPHQDLLRHGDDIASQTLALLHLLRLYRDGQVTL